ncbi:MAG: ABC transporter permease subunit [Solitalea-like symbiont of Acarus siro]
MYILLKKELKLLLYNTPVYIVIALILLSAALFLWISPNADTNLLKNQYVSMDSFNYILPWLLLLGIPAICMKSFAEEIKDGTLDLLKTSNVNKLYILLAKFISNLLIILLCLVPTLIYVISVNQLTLNDTLHPDVIISSYFSLILLSMCFISISLFASIVSPSQIIAFILAFFICFLFFSGLDSISNINSVEQLDWIIKSLSLNEHYMNLNRGLIKIYSLIYMLSLVYLFLLFSYIILRFRT